MNVWAIILAAGSGSRLADATGGTKKQFLTFRGTPLFWHSAATFSHVARIRGLIFVFPESDLEDAKAQLASLDNGRTLGLPWKAIAGGERRQDSVRNGLGALPAECTHVLVHDAARPFASATLSNKLIDSLAHVSSSATANESPHGSNPPKGVIPALPVTDTIKRIDGDTVLDTPDRSTLRAVQTPQAFNVDVLRNAHEKALSANWVVTDDASILEQCGIAVQLVDGEPDNVKITNPEDLTMLETPAAPAVPVTGWGYDVHRYGNGRPMKLGGVPIAGGPEVIAHSDGDVLLHALTDALLGCMGAGDIGDHFPDSDEAFENASSGLLFNEIFEKSIRQGLRVVHADLTIIAQIPRLGPWKAQIKKNITRLLRLEPHQVNIKATTEEKMGFTGEKKGIKAVACVTALRQL